MKLGHDTAYSFTSHILFYAVLRIKEVFAQVAGRAGWQIVPPCWLMKSCLISPCVNEC